MKTRWSLSLPPLWISVHRRTSSQTRSSSHRWSTFSTLTLWSIFLALSCLVAPTLSHPFPFLYQRGNRYAYARNIRPLPCVAKGGDTGVCMFAWDCMKANGTHLGTCIDRFYFGSCCKLDSKIRPIIPDQTQEETNHIIDTPSVTVTVKPSPSNKPGLTESGMPEEEIVKPNMTGTGITGTGMTGEELVKPNMTGTGMTGIGITGEGIVKPEIIGHGMVKPDQTGPEMTGVGMVNPDMTGSEMTGEGMVKPGMTGPEMTGEGMVKPDMTGPEITGEGVKPDMTGPEITGEGVKPDMTGPEITGEEMVKPDMTGTEMTGEGIVKPDMTGPEMTGEGMVKPDTTGPEMTGEGMVKPGMTGPEITGEGTVKPDITGPAMIGEGMVTPDMTGPEMTGEEIVKPDMTDEGMVKPDMTEPGVTEPEIIESEISGTGFPEEGIIDTDITDSDITETELPRPELTGSVITDSEMTEAGIPGSEMTGPGLTKPETVDVGVQVSVNNQDLNEGGQPDMIGTDNDNFDIFEENVIDSNVDSVEGVEENLIIETDNESTGTGQKPDLEEIEIIGVTTESNYNDESDIADTTKSPGSYDIGDNSDPLDVIGEGQITGDSAIIEDGLVDKIPDKGDVFEQDLGMEGSSSSDESTNKPEDLYEDDETQESSTESAGFPEIEPASPIRSPTTDSPFDEVDKETVFPQSFVTTFAPLKQPSKPDEDKHSSVSDEYPDMAITVIPSAGKPVSSNITKTDNEADDDIELTTFLPTVTVKIEVDEGNIVENTESILNDIIITATEPSEIPIKPDITKPGVIKPDVETATELPGMPEESTVLGQVSIQLPGFPGINVIKPAKPSHGDDGDDNDDDDKKETPELPITVIPAAIKPTAKPEVEYTTEIKTPEAKPPGEAESTTDKINIEEFPDLIIISTTTESEQPLKPINIIPEVTIKPTTKPEAPVTDDSTDWVPIIFPGMQEKPKPTEKPVETSTEYIDNQVKPQKPEDEGEDMKVDASTTIASLPVQEIDLLDRLNSSKYTEICGRPVYPTKRIVGGSDASFGEFPWQVSLRQWRSVTFLHKCGAALLNENWAVTAAHCVENVQPEQLLLRLGEFDLERADEPYGFVERKVQIIATHPQFDARTFEYDLALLRFYEPVNFQPNIIPICIPHDDYNFIGDTGFVSGWGRLYEDGPLPSIMQKVPVPVITNPECEAMYKVAGYVEHIPQIFICAGYEAGLKDSCEGDSGGPMVIQRDGVWNLAGVISWGIGCALPNQPGVYTRISAFREWIEKIIVF